MPNWCDCELHIWGKRPELVKFRDFARGEPASDTAVPGQIQVLSEKPFIPYPAEQFAERAEEIEAEHLTLTERVIKRIQGGHAPSGYSSGGYEWCIANWGTKWGFCNPVLAHDGQKKLLYEFESAWSPPSPLIRKMGEMFPQLKFRLLYFEGSCAFQGCLEMEGGICTEDETSSYSGRRGG